MEGSLYLSLGAAVPRRQRRSGGFPSRPAAFYLKASWGQPHPHPHPRGWPWVPLAGLPSPAAAPGDRPGPLPPENKRDIQPPPAAARARPPGKLGVESAARDRLQKPPSRRPRRTWYLAAGAKRDAAVSCRPWGARAPASRSAACCCCCCCWPPRRSWPGRRPQRDLCSHVVAFLPESLDLLAVKVFLECTLQIANVLGKSQSPRAKWSS